MKSQGIKSFDKVIGNYYGRGPAPASLAQRTRTLLANYYGKPPTSAEPSAAASPPTPAAVAMSRDDGELLRQRPGVRRAGEFVRSTSRSPSGTDEYVIEVEARSTEGRPVRDPEVRREYEVEFLPQRQDVAPVSAAAAPSGPPPAAAPASRADTAPPPPPVAAVSEAKSADDAFMEDMAAILSGQMVYDPRAKATVRPGEFDVPPDKRTPPQSGPANSDAIFEKIAQSMQYANAYDVGTLELENRFADFDKLDELKRKAAADKKTGNGARPATATPGPVGSAEFLQDLDAIQSLRTQAPKASSPGPLSRPFYDTGEHVLFGGNYYPDQLRVGAGAGVPFSYGQIIAMADLFESAKQMMDTDAGQLTRIKALIERSTAYYAGNKTDPAKDVRDEEWDTVTGKRYLALAEMNFEHFSPNFLFRGAAFAGAANLHGDNKSAWESYHRLAIQQAQETGAAPAGNSSPLLPLEGALITNAFGDHFLTDAFAAGHLINKEAIVEYWKTQFFDGGSLKSEAKGFFERLAAKAFSLGQVKARFSELETVKSYFLFFHPNIDSSGRFADVLAGIAEKEPDRIANMVVKAIHDRLNADGVEVFNNAGDGTWRLTGDGTLDAKNRAIIQRAVEQSIANINDPSIMASNVDVDALLAKVWMHVPQLSAGSQQKVQQLVRQYVGPDSTLLVDAAARIIERKLDILINELIKADALRVA